MKVQCFNIFLVLNFTAVQTRQWYSIQESSVLYCSICWQTSTHFPFAFKARHVRWEFCPVLSLTITNILMSIWKITQHCLYVFFCPCCVKLCIRLYQDVTKTRVIPRFFPYPARNVIHIWSFPVRKTTQYYTILEPTLSSKSLL